MRSAERFRFQLCAALFGAVLITAAQAEEPERVQPSSGTFAGLRRASTVVAHTVGERLDRGHDWLYRRLEHFLMNVDEHYSAPERAPLLVPLSPLRIGFDGEFLNRHHAPGITAIPDFDATLRFPNIERRFKLFITSSNLSEAPGNSIQERNPARAGVRFSERSHIDIELGVHLQLKPTVFAALRWAPQFAVGATKLYPFVKPYLESGQGLGVSSGITLEQWHGRWVVRSASYANSLRKTAATSWTQTFLLGHAQSVIQERQYGNFTAGRDLACGTVARVAASGERLSGASLYEFSVTFKRPLHGGWLYGYFEPLVRWQRGSDWHPDAGFRIGVDALFWGLAADSAKAASICR